MFCLFVSLTFIILSGAAESQATECGVDASGKSSCADQTALLQQNDPQVVRNELAKSERDHYEQQIHALKEELRTKQQEMDRRIEEKTVEMDSKFDAMERKMLLLLSTIDTLQSGPKTSASANSQTV